MAGIGRRAAVGLALLALAALAAGRAPAAEGEAFKRYEVPGRGAVELPLPAGWHDLIERPPELDGPPTIVLWAGDQSRFVARITPTWVLNGVPVRPDDTEQLRGVVEAVAAKALPFAAEKSLPPRPLDGEAGQGFYFTATARNPRPGEYRQLTGGAVALDDLAVTFTIASGPGTAAEAERALEIVRRLRRARR